MIREEEGRVPNARRIDQLLDERVAAAAMATVANRPARTSYGSAA